LKDLIHFPDIYVIEVSGAHQGHFLLSFHFSSICCILKAVTVSSFFVSDFLLCPEPIPSHCPNSVSVAVIQHVCQL
jgi:hypothetical protein